MVYIFVYMLFFKFGLIRLRYSIIKVPCLLNRIQLKVVSKGQLLGILTPWMEVACQMAVSTDHIG